MNGHVDGDLVLLADGLLPAHREEQVRAHLEQCAACRELADAIAFSHRALSDIRTAELTNDDRQKIRASLSVARGRRSFHAMRWLAAAAVLIVVAGVFAFRPRARFVDAPRQLRSIERAALAPRPFERVESVRAALDRLRSHSGTTPNLKPDSAQRRLVSIHESTLVYDINGRSITLAVALKRNTPDAAPDLRVIKQLEVRQLPDARIFTWSAGRDAYSLIVPRGVDAAAACAICHDGTPTLEHIRSVARGV